MDDNKKLKIEALLRIINNKLDYCQEYIEECLDELEGMSNESCPEIYYHLFKCYESINTVKAVGFLETGVRMKDISCEFAKTIKCSMLTDELLEQYCSRGLSIAAYQIANKYFDTDREKAIQYYCKSFYCKYPEVKYEYDYYFDEFRWFDWLT